MAASGRLAAELTLAAPAGGRGEPMKRYIPSEGQGAPAPIRVPGQVLTLPVGDKISFSVTLKAR